MALFCISLMISNVEHLVIYLSDIFMSSLEKMSLQVLFPFFKLKKKNVFADDHYEFLIYFGS